MQVVLGSNPNGPVYVTSETIPLSLVWSRIPEHFGGEPGDQIWDRAQATVSSNLTGPTNFSVRIHHPVGTQQESLICSVDLLFALQFFYSKVGGRLRTAKST